MALRKDCFDMACFLWKIHMHWGYNLLEINVRSFWLSTELNEFSLMENIIEVLHSQKLLRLRNVCFRINLPVLFLVQCTICLEE